MGVLVFGSKLPCLLLIHLRRNYWGLEANTFTPDPSKKKPNCGNVILDLSLNHGMNRRCLGSGYWSVNVIHLVIS